MSQPPDLDPARQKIFRSMMALLKRAGLEYQGNRLEFDGQGIHYLDYGEGSPVLLVHGGGSGSAIWFRQIEFLSKTRRVIAPDHPIYGLSDQVAYRPPIDKFMAKYLIGFMDELGLDRVDAVGLSMGGQGVLAAAIANPERFGKLAVIDSAGLGSAFPLVFRLSLVPLIGRLITRSNRWGQDRFFREIEVFNTEFEDAGRYKQYAYDVTQPEGHGTAFRQSIRAITGWGGQRSIFSDEQLRSIKNQLLVIWGAHDKLFPVKHGHRLADLVPDATLHVIENGAHVPILDNPGQVNEILGGYLD